jgi:Glycosyl hydrolase family 26
MTAAPAGGPRLKRRGLLVLAALALPAACSRKSSGATRASVEAVEPPTGIMPSSAAPYSSLGPAVTVTASPSAAGKAHASHRGGAVPFEPGTTRLGAYLSIGGQSLSQSLARRRSQLGRDYDIVHIFCAWTERFERPSIGDSTLMISWNSVPYSQINTGEHDRTIAAAARNLAGMGKPTLLRWGWEMNGNWFDWDGSHNDENTAGYIKAWRRMHGIFADAGADNVAWIWSPNWNSAPDESWNRMQRYYPGDAYVDWVGVSGYDFDSESPHTLFSPIVSAYGKSKPLIISETAAIDHGGSTKASWTNDLSAYVKRTPEIGALVWFDTNTQSDSDYDFRIDSSSSELSAFRTMARNQHFS